MKKRIPSLLLLLTLCLLLALPVLGASERELPLVRDVYGLLTKAEVEELNARAERYSEQYECDVILIVVYDTGYYNVEDFTEEVYREYNFGWGQEKSGVILLLSMFGRDYDLAAYGYGNTAFTDKGKEWLMDEVLPYLKKDDWYGGFSKYLDLCADYLRQAREGKPVDRYGLGCSHHNGFRLSVPAVLGALIAGALIALIAVSVLRARMRSAVLQGKADDYRSGELQLTREEDRFLKKDVVRVRRESSSGGGGHGTSVRSSGFSHHSGKF